MTGEPNLETPGSSASDAELIQLVTQRDEQAMTEVVRRFQARVLNLAYRYLGDRDEAEVVAQDTFIKIWNRAETFRGSAQVWTWIYRITVNICLTNRIRHRIKTEELDESVAAGPAQQPREAFQRREQQAIIQRALDMLPEDQRMAIVLSRYEGMSYEEIGTVLGRSVPAVATLIFRAKERLRMRLTPFLRRGKLSP